MPPKKPKVFDVAKLQKMQPPMTVTVDKAKGNTKQPLHLPSKNGGPPGTGWDSEDVMQLTTYVLQAPNGGGGMYTASVTDSMGANMEWDFGFDPRTFPEVAPDGSIPSPAATGPVTGPIPGQTSWLMAGINPWVQNPPVNGYATPRPAPWAHQQQQPPAWWLMQQRQGQPDDRVRNLEERLRAAENANLQKSYESQLAAQRAESARQIDQLKEEMRRVAETTNNKGESETVRLLREQVTELKQMIANQANKGESEAVRALRDEVRAQKESAERARLDAQHREELRSLKQEISAANKGPDPMIEYLRESTRVQADAQKESARVQREIAQSQLNYMVNPAQLAEMMSKQGNTYNQHMRDFLTQVTGGFDIYRTMMEHALQMTGQPQSPGYALVGDGLARASDIAAQWLASQRDRGVAEAQSRAAQARAAAEAEQAKVYYAQQGIKSPDQLSGAEAPAPSEKGNGEADVINLEERRPVTDEQMFGEAWEQVQRLRAAVEEGSLSPEDTVTSILQGIAYTHEHQIVIPAFTLFAEGRFADLMDALLPGVDNEFLAQCVQLLYAQTASPEVEPPPEQPSAS